MSSVMDPPTCFRDSFGIYFKQTHNNLLNKISNSSFKVSQVGSRSNALDFVDLLRW